MRIIIASLLLSTFITGASFGYDQQDRDSAALSNSQEQEAAAAESDQTYFAVLPKPSRWLRQNNIAEQYLTRDPSNFYDGSLTFLGNLRKALMSNEFKEFDSETINIWKETANLAMVLPPPWLTTGGSAKLIFQDNNALIEVAAEAGENAAIGQIIQLGRKNASFEFDVNSVKDNQKLIIEVIMRPSDYYEQDRPLSQDVIKTLEVYSAILPKHFSVPLTRDYVSSKSADKGYYEILLNIKSPRNNQVAVTLDNFNINY